MTKEEILTKAVEKAIENGYTKTNSGLPTVEIREAPGGFWFYEEERNVGII